MRGLTFILAWFFVMLMLSPAGATVVWLNYTDGYPDECDRVCGRDDIYAMRFTPQAPCRLVQLWFNAEGEGQLEIHLWQDLDGLPNLEKDLMEPFIFDTQDGQRSYFIMLEDEEIAIDPPLQFHVGFIRQTKNGANMCMDATADWALRAKYFHDDSWVENEKDWFVELSVEYYDEPEEFYFSDVTEQANLTSLGSRLAWGDYDNDGDQDLLMSGKILYRNDGDGAFTDVSAVAGITELPSNGGLWADFNNDGWLDYFAMVSSLEQYDRFIMNNGDGTFTDITDTALLPGDHDLWPSEGAGWGDYDKDGYLDLYLANYEMPGEDLGIGTPDKLYHNNGDGTFTDVAPDLDLDPETFFGDHLCGRGVNWGDFNDDGWPDIYVSNYRLDANFLYLNNGDGTFTDVALEKGVQGYQINSSWGHTIGSAWGDFNNDGFLDLFNANLAHPRFAGFSDPSFLFLNNGEPDYDFTDATREAQIIFIETNSEPCLGDWNNDGWLDLLITNVYENFWQQLYRNNGDGTMSEVTYFSGLDIENGWGAAFVDYDEDGYLDVMSNKGLFRNNGNDNHWLRVQLECDAGDPFCVGARIEVQVVWDGGAQAREVSSGKGTTNGAPFAQHFGLNQCENVWRVTAKFLNGKQVTLYEVPSDQLVIINEDDASDPEPTTPTEPSTCAEVDYSEPGWPEDDDTVDDDAIDDDLVDDDAADDDQDQPPADDDGDDDDDDDGCGC